MGWSLVIEILGVVTAVVYIFLSIRQNILLWPVGLISSAFFIFVCFDAGIYADMGLQIYYLIISIYGWWYWSIKANDNTKKELPVSRLSKITWFVLLVVSIAIFFLLVHILQTFTDSNIPYWDAFTTSLSIVATWMLARKIIDNWTLWIIVDFVSVFLYIYREKYITSGLYLLYTVMAVVGYVKWKKDFDKSPVLFSHRMNKVK